jgi:hypothetical protein
MGLQIPRKQGQSPSTIANISRISKATEKKTARMSINMKNAGKGDTHHHPSKSAMKRKEL